MSAHITVVIHFLSKESVTFSAPTFKQLFTIVTDCEVKENIKPLYIELADAKLLYNREVFENYLNNQVLPNDFMNQLRFEGMFRNKIPLVKESIDVDEDSLWFKKGNFCILVDEDMYLEFPYNENFFRPSKI